MMQSPESPTGLGSHRSTATRLRSSKRSRTGNQAGTSPQNACASTWMKRMLTRTQAKPSPTTYTRRRLWMLLVNSLYFLHTGVSVTDLSASRHIRLAACTCRTPKTTSEA
eukprot:1572531-Rhodomonas_salina.1